MHCTASKHVEKYIHTKSSKTGYLPLILCSIAFLCTVLTCLASHCIASNENTPKQCTQNITNACLCACIVLACMAWKAPFGSASLQCIVSVSHGMACFMDVYLCNVHHWFGSIMEWPLWQCIIVWVPRPSWNGLLGSSSRHCFSLPCDIQAA